jgi:hypothetical protein
MTIYSGEAQAMSFEPKKIGKEKERKPPPEGWTGENDTWSNLMGMELMKAGFPPHKVAIKDEVLELISHDSAVEFNAIPIGIDLDGKTVVIAVSDSSDDQIKDDLEFLLSRPVKLIAAKKKDIKYAINMNYNPDGESAAPIESEEEPEDLKAEPKEGKDRWDQI